MILELSLYPRKEMDDIYLKSIWPEGNQSFACLQNNG